MARSGRLRRAADQLRVIWQYPNSREDHQSTWQHHRLWQTTPMHAGTSTDQTIMSGGLSRSYRLHLPTGYQVKQPQAIILAFHGYSMDAHDMEQYTGLSSLADQEDFITVYPQGTLDSGNQPAWATQRIYATGYSNGGGMTGLLACDLAKRIAAFAPVAGAFYPVSCRPGRSVPILGFHGTGDSVVSYTNPEMGWVAIPDWLHDWVKRDGCSSGPTMFVQTVDVLGEQWSGCGTGGGVVVHYRIEGGGHTWPGAQFDVSEEGPTTHTIDADAIMWQFFQAHPLPGA